ncbi:MAG TPA: hypothetical protein DDW48_08225, partial [Methyloceanibacter sp.]|nr:hypothetical protein [Methyloceanibacter sp.]
MTHRMIVAAGLALAGTIAAEAGQSSEQRFGKGSSDGREAVHSRKWHPWMESGGTVSNEDSRTESVLFAPLWQSATALFFT